MTVIIPKPHFLQIERGLFPGYTVMFNKSLFSKTPEALQAIDTNLAVGETFLMINAQVLLPAEHTRVITSEFVRVENAAPADHLDSMGKQRFGGSVLNGCDRNRRKGTNRKVGEAVYLKNGETFL